MGFVERLKELYFAAEDKYYAFLDAVQKKIPVYSVVDPVDKVLPSFGIILAVIVALLGLGLFSALSGFSFGEKVTLSLTINDASGSALSGVVVSLEKDGQVIATQTTKTNGKVALSVPSGTYSLRAIKDGFESLFQEVELSKSKSQIFVLKDLVSPAKQRVLLIQDPAGNVLGVLSPVSISLSFSCQSGTPPASQTTSNGSVTIQQPGNCKGLSVNVSATGFISTTQLIVSDTTIITLQDSAALSPPDTAPPTGGTVEIFAKLANGTGIDQAQIKLYKIPAAGSNVLVNQTLSDPNGLGVFENVTPGRHVVIVSKTGFKQTTSAEFQVNAGETISQTITVPVSSNKRKILVKIVSSLNQLPVSGAMVTLFAQTSQGNFIEYDSYTSDANGMVNQLLADFNGNTSLLVEHANYVTEIAPNTGIVPEDQSAPVPILLDPLQAANANGTIPNALIINVKVTDEVGLPVFNAPTYLHTPDGNGITLSMVRTNASGIAKFSNLPAGSYQATVNTNTADGTSAIVQGSVGQIVNLPVTLTLGNALIKVTVKDELNSFVADANVSIFSVNGDGLQSRGTTNAQGFVQLGVATGQQVYVKVEKDSYLPFISVPFDVIKNNAHSITIEVALTSSSQAADISLQRIDQIAANGAVSLAQSLVADGLYAFHFTVKSLVAQNQLKAVVRLNGDNATPQAVSDVGRVLGGQAAKGAIAFYTTHNPSDVFSPTGSVDSNTAAKVALNSVGDVNGAASYEMIVFVKIKTGAVPQTDKLDVRFQAKSAVNISSEYFESYTIGQPLNQSNFSFVFFVTAPGSNVPVQLNSAVPLVVEKDLDYKIDYQLSNTSGNNQPNAVLNLVKDVGTLSTSVNSVSVPMNNNATISGSFTLRSTLACGSAVAYCATLTPTLNGVGGNTPPSFPIRIFTTPAKTLFMSVFPSFLIPSQPQLVQVTVRDQLNAVVGASQGVQVVGQVKDSAGQAVGNSIPFTSSPFNVFSGAIPASANGNVLEITASASGYFSDVENILITDQVSVNFSQDFGCLTLGTVSPFALGSSGTLHVSTQNCPSSLKLYTTGAGAIKVDVKDPSAPVGSQVITSSNPLALGATASKNLTVYNPSSGFGMYPLYVYARYDNQPTSAVFVLVKNVDVLVQPLLGNNNCLNLSKYAFDIKNGSDAAEVINRCNPEVHDAFFPQATLPVNGVYAHTVPSVLTPEMQNPGSAISFNYAVDVDYNSSFDTDLNHSDFARNPPFDGNWARYAINGADHFFDERNDYIDPQGNVRPGVEFQLIPDAQLISGVFVLEQPSSALMPWAKPLSKRSVLFESTFITTNAVSLDKLCITSSSLANLVVNIDGVVVQTSLGGSCMLNVYLAPGPHVIQLFMYKGSAADYALYVRYGDAPFTSSCQGCSNGVAKLSNGVGRGFFLSPEYGSTFARGNRTNGPYSSSGSAALVPSASYRIPAPAASLWDTPEGTDLIRILLNRRGIDYLKQAYVNVSTDNPSVRAFVSGGAVRAQYVGFDTPSTPQQFFVENTAMNGEQYGVVTLEDYSTGSTSAGSKTLDLGVLLDVSPSVLLNERDENVSFTSGIRQEGICNLIRDLKDSMEYYSGATVNLKVALMGTVSSFYHKSSTPAQNLPCLNALNANSIIILNNTSFTGAVPNATFDSKKHNLNEAWAWAAEKFAGNNFWSNPNRMMVIITDNKPSGLGSEAPVNAWDTVVEQALTDHASSVLQSSGPNGIRGVVLYKAPLQSTSTDAFSPGNAPDANPDAIQMYQAFASNTNGFVEQLDNSEIINAAANPYVWEHASTNKVGIRLVQTAFPRVQESMVVKLVAQPANACIGENGEVGLTGPAAFPKLFYDWRWTSLQNDTCDAKLSDPSNFKYCDSTQFTMSLIKKLHDLELAYAPSATPAQLASIPSLENFDAYLMYDGLSDDFRSDFTDYYEHVDFAQTPPYFMDTGAGQGVWRDYLLSPDRFSFTIDGVENAVKVPAPGLYRTHLDITWDGDEGQFFLASSPHAHVKVVLTKLANASALSGYTELLELPLDGGVGTDGVTPLFNRNGYGTAFTGEVVPLVQYTGLTLQTFPNESGSTALNTYAVPPSSDVVALNSQQRGELFRLDRTQGVLHLRPTLPVPLAMEWSSNSLGKGDVFYAVRETSSTQFISSNSLLKWTPYASVKKLPVLTCSGNNCAICTDGGANPFLVSVVADSNPISGTSCATSPLPNSSPSTFFGFTSVGSADNNSYLSSIFYRVPGKDYTLFMGCNSTPQGKPAGRILSMNGIVDEGHTTTSLDTTGSPLDVTFNKATSLAGMLDLVSNDYTCIATTAAGKTKVYWNSEKIRDGLTTSSSFGANNACTATGSPFGVAGLFTLKERGPVSLVPPLPPNAGLCPLFNTGDAANGYFGQRGVPYPVGTKILHLDLSPITNDPLSSMIQYRFNATVCHPNTTAVCAGANQFCTVNMERYWTGVFNLQP